MAIVKRVFSYLWINAIFAKKGIRIFVWECKEWAEARLCLDPEERVDSLLRGKSQLAFKVHVRLSSFLRTTAKHKK